MRVSSLHDTFASAGGTFGERFGTEIVTHVKDRRTEYHYIRDTAGVTDFSHVQVYRVPGETGLDHLDSVIAGNVAKIRFGRILHTCLLNTNGMILADCYIANNDDEFLVLMESIVDDAAVRAIMLSEQSSGIEELTGSQVVISIDGFKAWAVVKELFGSDVLGLPYLSIETYSFDNVPVKLLRAGKTSEFGYLLVAPVNSGSSLLNTLSGSAVKQGGGLCGITIHNDLRLEGRFFNVYSEGVSVRDPLALGLQWMIDFEKDHFTGRVALIDRRKSGLTKKIIGVSTEESVSIKPGDSIYAGEVRVAEITGTCFSNVLNRNLGLALFDINVAYAGLSLNVHSPQGPEIKTISMPPIIPKSLSVRIDEM
jgi:aminomethyltransferase